MYIPLLFEDFHARENTRQPMNLAVLDAQMLWPYEFISLMYTAQKVL